MQVQWVIKKRFADANTTSEKKPALDKPFHYSVRSQKVQSKYGERTGIDVFEFSRALSADFPIALFPGTEVSMERLVWKNHHSLYGDAKLLPLSTANILFHQASFMYSCKKNENWLPNKYNIDAIKIAFLVYVKNFKKLTKNLYFKQ